MKRIPGFLPPKKKDDGAAPASSVETCVPPSHSNLTSSMTSHFVSHHLLPPSFTPLLLCSTHGSQRGQHADYDSWARTCGEDWSWSEVRPFFEEHLDYRIDAFEGTTEINPDDKHSTGGEWRVENQRLSWEILDRFEQAAIDSGLPRNLHLNNSNFEGVGYFQVNQKRGIRLSSYRAFLKPVMDRPNLTVVTDSLCKRLVLEGNEVKGVEVWGTEGKPDMFYGAQKELILSAGSVGSSQLLEVSGIGAAEILAKAGVEMRHHLEGVGENLHDHLQIRSVFRLKDGTPSLNTMANSLTGNLKIGLEYMVNQSGPMSMAPSQMGIFAKSSQEFKTPNIQYHIQPLSLDGFGEPLHDFPGLTLSVCNLRPKSRGSVHIASPDSRTSPLIDPNYLSHPDDRKVAVDSLKHARRLASMAAMEELDPVEHFPGSEITTDAELALAAGRISTSIFHPVSTCKMGPATDKTAVVDPRLRVHGLKRLRVADGSVMPNITSGNTNSPILMIGEKASAMILEDNT